MIQIEKVREKFNIIRIEVYAFISEHKIAALAFLGGILLVSILGIVLIAFTSSADKKQKIPYTAPIDLKFEELFLPGEPGVQMDLLFSHERKFQWDETELNRWFVEPDDALFQELQEANKKIIGDVLQSVP